jgi:hypothetical protein
MANPSRLPESWRDDRALGFFTRHFVPIYLDLRWGDKQCEMLLSGFAFSALGRWVLGKSVPLSLLGYAE